MGGVVSFIAGLQQPDGSFAADRWGEALNEWWSSCDVTLHWICCCCVFHVYIVLGLVLRIVCCMQYLSLFDSLFLVLVLFIWCVCLSARCAKYSRLVWLANTLPHIHAFSIVCSPSHPNFSFWVFTLSKIWLPQWGLMFLSPDCMPTIDCPWQVDVRPTAQHHDRNRCWAVFDVASRSRVVYV